MKFKDACSLEGKLWQTYKDDNILKSRDFAFLAKVHLVKAMVFPVVMCRYENWTIKGDGHQRIDAFKSRCWEDAWESHELEGDQTSLLERKSFLSVHWNKWCWSWSSNTLATWCKELTHWKRPCCCEDWRQEEKGTTEDEMVGWHHWLSGWIWVGSGSWWCTGRPGVLQSMGLQRVGHDWVTELNWTEYILECQKN